MKHTPGPWRVIELKNRFGVYDDDGESIAKVDGAFGVAMERRKADAHLIAAAPLMYEALAEIFDRNISYANSCAEDITFGMVQKARAALKAAGVES